jgi:hypothetical protein
MRWLTTIAPMAVHVTVFGVALKARQKRVPTKVSRDCKAMAGEKHMHDGTTARNERQQILPVPLLLRAMALKATTRAIEIAKETTIIPNMASLPRTGGRLDQT